MNEETEIRKTKVKTNEKEYEGNVKLIYVLITKEIFIRQNIYVFQIFKTNNFIK